MKIIYVSLLSITLLGFAFCKSTKSASTSAPATFEPAEKQLAIAQARYPGTTAEQVKNGQNIFVTKCTECHKAYEITRFSEKKWLHEIDDMSPKAKLTPEEKLDLTRHIISYREAYTVANN